MLTSQKIALIDATPTMRRKVLFLNHIFSFGIPSIFSLYFLFLVESFHRFVIAENYLRSLFKMFPGTN